MTSCSGGAAAPRALSARSSSSDSEGKRLGARWVMMTWVRWDRSVSRSRHATEGGSEGRGAGGVSGGAGRKSFVAPAAAAARCLCVPPRPAATRPAPTFLSHRPPPKPRRTKVLSERLEGHVHEHSALLPRRRDEVAVLRSAATQGVLGGAAGGAAVWGGAHGWRGWARPRWAGVPVGGLLLGPSLRRAPPPPPLHTHPTPPPPPPARRTSISYFSRPLQLPRSSVTCGVTGSATTPSVSIGAAGAGGACAAGGGGGGRGEGSGTGLAAATAAVFGRVAPAAAGEPGASPVARRLARRARGRRAARAAAGRHGAPAPSAPALHCRAHARPPRSARPAASSRARARAAGAGARARPAPEAAAARAPRGARSTPRPRTAAAQGPAPAGRRPGMPTASPRPPGAG
jgi:hypothetical protein